jgi:hypothetical protein
MNKDTIYWIVIIILAAMTFHFWQRSDTLHSNLSAKKAVLENTRLENGMLLSSIESYKVSEREIENQLWVKDDSLNLMVNRYKNLVGTIGIETSTRVDTIRITLAPPSIAQPNRRYFTTESPFYSISGFASENFLRIDSLRVPNTQRIVIGQKKGFWNNQITAEIHNSNPHVETVDLESQIVLKQKIKRFGVGPYIGLDILLRPSFGIGVSYDVWRF